MPTVSSPRPCWARPASWRSRSSGSWAAPRPSGALAYGTESIGRVDKIVGPGNAWVTAAKLEVLDSCAIDMPAGPTEVMVVADDSADPVHVAADLLSQAEHGPDSPSLLVTPSEALADAVEVELAATAADAVCAATRWPSRSRAAGTVVITADIEEALAFADEYAPEHLSCVVADEDAALAALSHAGSLFLGPYAPESAGDYAAGSNHVLPTAGAGRAYSPLGVGVIRSLDAGQPRHPRAAWRASCRPSPRWPRPRA